MKHLNENSLDVNELKDGVYSVKLDTDKGIMNYKLVVKK
ncbi:MAG: T9SS type A sorting domain-containing protein [Flavobacterium sp.]|nr:T9SS type A sorting domain-containing protein [Flavobacterium sp.]